MKKEENSIPEEYRKLKIYNWNGTWYFNNKPCEKVTHPKEGNVIEAYNERFASFEVHDTGYIIGSTMGGIVYLKVLQQQGNPKEEETTKEQVKRLLRDKLSYLLMYFEAETIEHTIQRLKDCISLLEKHSSIKNKL